MTQATTAHSGRYLETMRAVKPDFVTLMMADAFKSIAVVQQAWEMAFVISGFTSVVLSLKRLR